MQPAPGSIDRPEIPGLNRTVTGYLDKYITKTRMEGVSPTLDNIGPEGVKPPNNAMYNWSQMATPFPPTNNVMPVMMVTMEHIVQ